MVPDKMGFYYPRVKTEQCIKCGLCQSRCPVYSRNASGEADYIAEAYAVVGKNEKIRKKVLPAEFFILLQDTFFHRME